ncbi:MAG: hypothetical protein M3154_03555 [Candidatus Eremiobacteraeota bacterium]|nr:hypothetical protein [Candidatus Eremiobacteraeota bacterium]
MMDLTPDPTRPDLERARRPDAAVSPTATPRPETATDTDAELLTGHPAPVVQQWLDGERTEAEARRDAPQDVALWAQVQGETERRGRMVTPAPVLDRIMAAIPATPEPESEGMVDKVKKLFGK